MRLKHLITLCCFLVLSSSVCVRGQIKAGEAAVQKAPEHIFVNSGNANSRSSDNIEQQLPKQARIQTLTFANIRSGPSTSDDMVAKLPKGMAVKIKSVKKIGKWQWFEILFQDGNKSGWTREDNLDLFFDKTSSPSLNNRPEEQFAAAIPATKNYEKQQTASSKQIVTRYILQEVDALYNDAIEALSARQWSRECDRLVMRAEALLAKVGNSDLLVDAYPIQEFLWIYTIEFKGRYSASSTAYFERINRLNTGYRKMAFRLKNG
ncbi:SH3 domain-containing protein [bacterium]|nr:SH3 domain-containing protein [bacterium]